MAKQILTFAAAKQQTRTRLAPLVTRLKSSVTPLKANAEKVFDDSDTPSAAGSFASVGDEGAPSLLRYVIASGVGAAAGFGIAATKSKKTRSRIIGAAIGAGVGALGAFVWTKVRGTESAR